MNARARGSSSRCTETRFVQVDKYRQPYPRLYDIKLLSPDAWIRIILWLFQFRESRFERFANSESGIVCFWYLDSVINSIALIAGQLHFLGIKEFSLRIL